MDIKDAGAVAGSILAILALIAMVSRKLWRGAVRFARALPRIAEVADVLGDLPDRLEELDRRVAHAHQLIAYYHPPRPGVYVPWPGPPQTDNGSGAAYGAHRREST